MSGPDRNASEDPEVLRERIAQELAALGEDPLQDPQDPQDPVMASSDDELALEFALADGDPHADIDVATLQTLAGWAQEPHSDPDPEQDPSHRDDELSEIAQARVWRTIELRAKRSELGKQDSGPTEISPARSTRPVLLAVVALFAVAAGVVLVPVLTADKPGLSEESPVARAPASVTAEELDVLSTQARAGLAALDRLSGEPTGTARVEALASDYAGRLDALGDSPRGSQG